VGVQPASQIGRHILSSHPVVKTRSLKTELPQETERLVDGKGSLEEPNEIIARGLYCLHQKFHTPPTLNFPGEGTDKFCDNKKVASVTPCRHLQLFASLKLQAFSPRMSLMVFLFNLRHPLHS
jgi:hypothetical protein